MRKLIVGFLICFSGCATTTGPVVMDITEGPGGVYNVQKCDLEIAPGAFGQIASLKNCRTTRLPASKQ